MVAGAGMGRCVAALRVRASEISIPMANKARVAGGRFRRNGFFCLLIHRCCVDRRSCLVWMYHLCTCLELRDGGWVMASRASMEL